MWLRVPWQNISLQGVLRSKTSLRTTGLDSIKTGGYCGQALKNCWARTRPWIVDGNPKVSRVLKKTFMFSFTWNVILLKKESISVHSPKINCTDLQHRYIYKAVFRLTQALCGKMPPPHLFESHCCVGTAGCWCRGLNQKHPQGHPAKKVKPVSTFAATQWNIIGAYIPVQTLAVSNRVLFLVWTPGDKGKTTVIVWPDRTQSEF